MQTKPRIEPATLSVHDRRKEWLSQDLIVQQLREHFNLSDALEDPESFPAVTDLTPRNTVVGFTSLISPVSKNNTPPSELKAEALETLQTRFPETSWLRVYTDGSAVGATRNGGAGVYSVAGSIAAPVGRLDGSFDGEIRAAVLALDIIRLSNRQRAVILTDSQAAIVALSSTSRTESLDVVKGRKGIEELGSSGITIVLQWIAAFWATSVLMSLPSGDP